MRLFICILLALTAPVVGAAELRDVRLWNGDEATRVVFDLNQDVQHKVFTLSNPDRIVIDISNVDEKGVAVATDAQPTGVVERIRSAPREGGDLRVVLDLDKTVTPKSFMLPPDGSHGYRLVLDLYGPTPSLSQLQAGGTPSVSADSAVNAVAVAAPEAKPAVIAPAVAKPADTTIAPTTVTTTMPRPATRPIIVAIDPGHGGQDPGAIGYSGLMEKTVTLAIARRLAKLVDAQPGYRAVLTRDGDYYVGLRDRINKARMAQADLFISIHANAYKNRSTQGSAVFVLSDRGASSESARWLAQKENAADMVGGVDVQDKDKELAAVLIDLSQQSTLEASFDVGGRILNSLGKVNPLVYDDVQQAAFVVLKAPDIPSVLVETAFITNAKEERQLADGAYQDRLAHSLLNGIDGYFNNYRPNQQLVQKQDGNLQSVAYHAGAGNGAVGISN